MTTWMTKNGRIIPLTEMTDEHIRNAINMLVTQQDCYSVSCSQDGCTWSCQRFDDMIENFELELLRRERAG